MRKEQEKEFMVLMGFVEKVKLQRDFQKLRPRAQVDKLIELCKSRKRKQGKQIGSYGADNGLFQEVSEYMTRYTPTKGYTENPYIDLDILISNMYYDAYQNGLSRLQGYERAMKEYGLPFKNKVGFYPSKFLGGQPKTQEKEDRVYQELEETIDRILAFILLNIDKIK